jgi:hypothetical protein
MKSFVGLTLAVFFCGGYAVADPVAVLPGAFSGSTVTVDFLSFASGTLITNQLATAGNFGLTFSGMFANNDYFANTGVTISATNFSPSGGCPCTDEILSFSSPVQRIGFDLFGGNAGTTIFTNSSTGKSVGVVLRQFPLEQFIGIQDAAGITSLTIDAPTDQAFLVDKLELDPGGTAAPEPGLLLPLALMMGGLGFFVSRRKKTSSDL